ncbi:MAG: hypothetical protein ACI4W2_00180 [Eubacterium sp.]
MKLKGEMVLELTDTNTGEVETVKETNMITNAINNILGINPMALWYKTSGEYDDCLLWNSNMFPICPNMIGGILLFSKTLTEDVDNIYPSSDNLPVAYASNDVNSTANVARGSLNLTESKALDDGYKFVWEFTASQGNGTIAAVGLTSKQGGTNAWGSTVDSATPYLYVRNINIGSLDETAQMRLFRTVEIDFENNILYSIKFEDSAVTIEKCRYPVFNIGLNEKLDDSTVTVLETHTITCETFKFYGSYTPYGTFLDGKDGYWYGFSNQANSSGNATMLWIKISKTDYSYTEGSWTLTNTYLLTIGSCKYDSYPCVVHRGVIRNGYLYVIANAKTGIYKINLSNSADITLIEFGFTSANKPLGGSGSSEVYLTKVNDLIVGWDYVIDVNDNVIQTAGTQRFDEDMGTQVFQYKEYLTCFCSSYGTEAHKWFILTPYLASINNLSSSVVKNADKTMKITYTLTEDTSDSSS